MKSCHGWENHVIEPWQDVTDTRERKSLGSLAERETWESGLVSRESGDGGCLKKKKNIAFGQHNILGNFAKTQKKRDRNNNIPGGSLGPGVLLESGHIVQLK
jgi:hypothetical protein